MASMVALSTLTPVAMTTGRCQSVSRIRRSTSTPSMSGRSRSSRTTSTREPVSARNPPAPVTASMMSKWSSRMSLSDSRTPKSSSTTRTRRRSGAARSIIGSGAALGAAPPCGVKICSKPADVSSIRVLLSLTGHPEAREMETWTQAAGYPPRAGPRNASARTTTTASASAPSDSPKSRRAMS